MTADTLRFILQVVAIFLGGGSVQLGIFLLKRRSELHSLDTASDATALNSANAYVITLQAGEKALRDEVEVLKAEVRRIQASLNSERTMSTDALDNASREVQRAHAELARTKADLSVAQAQISQRDGSGPGRHRDSLDTYDDWRKGP
jgi:chromosome segregation ATPase